MERQKLLPNVTLKRKRKDKLYCLNNGESTNIKNTLKLRGLSPHANYTDRAAAAGRRS